MIRVTRDRPPNLLLPPTPDADGGVGNGTAAQRTVEIPEALSRIFATITAPVFVFDGDDPIAVIEP